MSDEQIKNSAELALKVMSDHGVDVVDSVVHMSGDVDSDMYDKLVHDLSILESFNPDGVNDLTVFLSTYGGDVYFGFAIYDYLKMMTKNGHLKIVCSGPVMSAGVLILQAATERVMMPNAHLLVHFGMEVNDNQQTKHQHEQLTKEIKTLMVNRCTAKEQTVKKWFSKESYFDKKRAIEVGLIDRVVEYG